jgi:hypothetical protein
MQVLRILVLIIPPVTNAHLIKMAWSWTWVLAEKRAFVPKVMVGLCREETLVSNGGCPASEYFAHNTLTLEPLPMKINFFFLRQNEAVGSDQLCSPNVLNYIIKSLGYFEVFRVHQQNIVSCIMLEP